MGTQSARNEPFAWRLAGGRIGANLRDYCAASQELPCQIRAHVERLVDAIEGDQFREESSPDAPSLLNKLDAIEDNQLLRAWKTRLGALCCLQRSGSFT
jgi:hypothetical protein